MSVTFTKADDFTTLLIELNFFSFGEMETFLKIRASLNNANKFYYYLLTVVSRNCKLKGLRFLTERGANISVCYTKNNTAVHFVVVPYTVNIIKLLLG